jgi:hypothetical protein
VQVEHSGWSRVPPRTASTRPQPAQRARRCWQVRHHGRPVVREITHELVFPQMAQVKIFNGWQLGHSGPSGVRVRTGRRRRQFTQVS